MKRLKILVLLTIVGVLVANNVNAAEDRPLHEIHSMMLFNFSKYINWPANNTSGNFVIGVVGSDQVYETLSAWYSTKSRGNQKIVIKKFDSPADITNCEVLYLAKSSSKYFEEIKIKLKGKSTLLISDKAGLGKKGSSINFKLVGGKLKFELNKNAIEQANLKVSSQLAAMAIII